MKFLTKKEENKERGFALLFSVLVSSLLLTIGLSIFNIALKELAISTATRQSIHAFYAADSGREEAIYLDTKLGIVFDEDEIETILSDGGPITIPISDDDFTLVEEAEGPNYYAEVKKIKNDGECGDKAICTTVTSYGHDVVSGDRVERAIQQSY